jgi:hypothetical protein
VADLRRRLEARLAQLHARRQQSLDAAAAELAGQAGVADRKHQFVKKWRRIHAKTLPIPQLEALLAEAEEVVRCVCVCVCCVCVCARARVCVVLCCVVCVCMRVCVVLWLAQRLKREGCCRSRNPSLRW